MDGLDGFGSFGGRDDIGFLVPAGETRQREGGPEAGCVTGQLEEYERHRNAVIAELQGNRTRSSTKSIWAERVGFDESSVS